MTGLKKYFRNKFQIKAIDPHILWILESENLVLVDDDQYFALPFDEHKDNFYEVPIPDELNK